jgi:hypothetical protein
MKFFEFPDTGLSTASEQIAAQHKQNYQSNETVVPVISMDSLLNQFEGRQIHWLKIDVEGFEHNVIQSWAKSLVRPWILVIESTLPSSQILSHYNWEQLILAKGYRFAYFDGLNRFYVHEKHLNLLDKFAYPPNIFDGFISANQHFYQQNNLKLEQELNAKQKQSDDLANQIKKLKEKEKQLEYTKLELANLNHQIDAIYTSRSWRITKPLRLTSSRLKPLIKNMARPVLKFSMNFIQKNPKLKQYINKCLRLFPKLEQRLKLFTNHYGNNLVNATNNHIKLGTTKLSNNLSSHETEIYNKLKQQIKNKQGN